MVYHVIPFPKFSFWLMAGCTSYVYGLWVNLPTTHFQINEKAVATN